MNPLYQEDLERCLDSVVNLERLKGKTLLITGATGMIGSFIVDVLMLSNKMFHVNCSVIAMGRNEEKARKRFASYWDVSKFSFVQHDINTPLHTKMPMVDFVIHAASTTHPVAYATNPIETITSNVWGTKHLLDYICSSAPLARLVLMSSVEIYGQNRGDVHSFDEKYCGYIDCNTMRAGYPESKRLSETLCQAYRNQRQVNYVIARIPRTYGPTMLKSDTKALSQFIKKGIAKENIVLKSKGEQLFSYVYVADVVSAVLTIMLAGESGESYNISSPDSDVKLRDVAKMIANLCETSLVFELPDSTEAAGYSTASVAVMDSSKLRKLGWKQHYAFYDGIQRTLVLLRQEIKS